MLIDPKDLLREHLHRLGKKDGKARKKKSVAKRRRATPQKAARKRAPSRR
jgi:hypothetical protein